MKKCDSGFTLIELLIAMVVLGILLGISVPSFQGYMRNQQVRNVSESIQNGIRTAQMEAVRRNTPVTYWMVTSLGTECALATPSSWTGSWVVGNAGNGLLDDGTSPATRCDSDTFLQKNAGIGNMGGMTLSSQNDGNCIVFNGFGQALAQHATCAKPISKIDVKGGTGEQSLSVIINNGSIRLCDPAKPASDARSCPA